MVNGCYHFSILLLGVAGSRLFLAVHIGKDLQPGCPCLAGQSPFCFSSNLPGSLDQHCSNPSFAWSVHNYIDARYHLRDDTQATEDPQGSPCAWCILLTPLGLIPRESWFRLIPRHMLWAVLWAARLGCFLRRNLRCGDRAADYIARRPSHSCGLWRVA